jgi:hypothetical protein
LPLISSCGGSDVHDIEFNRLACYQLKENQNTWGMIECEIEALNKWQTELSSVETEFCKTLPPEQLVLYNKSMEAWNTYCLEHKKFLNKYYSTRGGTMWAIVNLHQKSMIYKKKVEQLQCLMDTIK